MFWNNFLELCKKSNISPNGLAKKLDISSGSISAWKNGRVPKWQTLDVLADYFNVSVEELISEEKSISQPVEPNAVFLDDKRVYMIPMYESVSAGFGASAINEVVGYEPCHIPNPADAAESLCIRVSGDSMFPKIEDGDIIQVHKQTSVDSGSIAVVLLDNEEGLVKKVLYGDDWIELHSINPMYPIQRFDGKDVLRIKVVGLVKAIIKRL